MSEWHAPLDTLDRYAREARSLDAVTASSVEAHLLACESCRARVSLGSPADLIDRSWHDIAAAIDQPRRSTVERALARVVSPDAARLVLATPALRLATVAASVIVIAALVAVCNSASSASPFLAMAPLVPLAAVLLTFWPSPDPGGEGAQVAPLAGAGLALRRTQAVLALTTVLLTLGALALPDLGLVSLAWVLPSVAITSAALALATWIPPMRATAVCAGAWVALVAGAAFLNRRSAELTTSALFDLAGQATFLVLAAGAVIVFAARRQHYTLAEEMR